MKALFQGAFLGFAYGVLLLLGYGCYQQYQSNRAKAVWREERKKGMTVQLKSCPTPENRYNLCTSINFHYNGPEFINDRGGLDKIIAAATPFSEADIIETGAVPR